MSSPVKLQIIFALLGISLIIFGIFFSNKIDISSSSVEVLQTANPGNAVVEKNVNDKITVDISGAVVTPGVYKLNFGSRIDDLIIVSGGLAENADKNWIDKNLNRAAKLVDGQKVYIPFQQSNVLGANNSTPESYVAQSSSTSDST